MEQVPDWSVINFSRLPPLKHISMTSIIIKLWELPDTVALFYESCSKIRYLDMSDDISSELEPMIKHVSGKLTTLPLPAKLLEEMFGFIRPICMQVFEWKFDDSYPDVFKNRVDCIAWAADGVIDKFKTLQKLDVVAGVGQIHLVDLFKCACHCCSEDYILNLWNRLPEKDKHILNDLSKYDIHDDDIFVAYWLCFCQQKLNDFLPLFSDYEHSMSFDENMVTLSVSFGNCLAVMHFFRKLAAEAVKKNIKKWLKLVVTAVKNEEFNYQRADPFIDIMFFLLSQLNAKETQRKVLQKLGRIVLPSLFACWPWQRFLLPTLSELRNDLQKKAFDKLLSLLAYQVGNKSVVKILRQIWPEIPMHYKKRFYLNIINFEYTGAEDLIECLIDAEDYDTMFFVLEEATPRQRKEILHC